MFFASRRPAHNTQVSQERFWSKNEKPFFDDVILDDDMILDDDVMYVGQTTRDLIKIGRSHPNHHQKHYFYVYSCKWSPAYEI